MTTRRNCLTGWLACIFLSAYPLLVAAQASAWIVDAPADASAPTRALVSNAAGASLAVHRDADGVVFMTFATTTVSGLSRASCPTFQIDERTPQHFYNLGQSCSIAGHEARYVVTKIDSNSVVSLVLDRLINGGRIAFRYVSQSGDYHEDIFSLRESKKALLAALGENLTVAGGDER